ncbi:MAG TPA: response regulator [Candidatus Paceibacterota bacterium]|nr:response regulator [Candidatus Paceibacterota bacterium]
MREKPLILIVDDEPNLLEIISTKLGESGFEPVVAYNAKEAVDAAGKLHPDLILMDVHMPEESGTDAALAIKQNEATKDLHIAFLSNLKDPWPSIMADKKDVSKEMGMVDFIDKSADLDVIVARVRELLGIKK